MAVTHQYTDLALHLHVVLRQLNHNPMKFKNIITSGLVGIALSHISHAEESTLKDDLRGNPSKVTMSGDVPQRQDAYIVHDGTVMLRKDGKTTAMESDMELENGTMVMMNGTVKTTDGNVIILKQGDEVTMKGEIIKPTVFVHKDGKMLVRRDGKDLLMTETRVIADGTKVMTDGTILTKDGKAKKLGDNQQIDWDGRIKSAEIVKAGPPGKQ